MRAILWNIGKADPLVVEESIARCDSDLIVLPECPSSLLSPPNLMRITSPRSRLAIFAAKGGARIVYEDPTLRLAAAVLKASGILVVGCHLRSRLHGRNEDTMSSAIRLRTFIEKSESLMGHERTIVLGDMNMDPYDPGMVHFEGLHAVMSKSIAARGSRTYQDTDRRFFYNPMWNLYGDLHKNTAATYYFSQTQSMTYYWHMLDQILIRPGLVESLRRIEILESIGNTAVIDQSRRSRIVSCDHLPVLLEMELAEKQVDQKTSEDGQ